jgi:organic radical activating enzyme
MNSQLADQIGKSQLVNGFIHSPTHLELIATDHCNLNCTACNHASPLVPAWFADPDKVYRDFSIIAKYYRPKFIKVLGGEPLLHKNLDRVVNSARETGISDYFTLITNGVFLHKARDEVWKAIDEMEISLYPGVLESERNIKLAKAKADAFGKKLTICRYEQFRATFSLKGTSDKALIQKNFAACKIANVWGCHAVKDGCFYRCPQTIYSAMLTGKSNEGDRLQIVESDTFQKELLEYVNSPVPLSSCAHCAGTVGVQQPWKQMSRATLLSALNTTLEEIVDSNWLERSLLIKETCDDCRIPTCFLMPDIIARSKILRRFWEGVFSMFFVTGSLRPGKRPKRGNIDEKPVGCD